MITDFGGDCAELYGEVLKKFKKITLTVRWGKGVQTQK